MLFSRADVAAYINNYFEPVWESVRPVPIVRIDFGNGTVVTRTLHGNIATYACTAEGQVLDIVAGIYTPAAYVERLQQFGLLTNYVDQQGKEKRSERLRDYHRGQAEALRKNEKPAVFVNIPLESKRQVEATVKAVLVPGRFAKASARPGFDVSTVEAPRLGSAEDLANWKLLAEDTRLNETVRRQQVHEMLAAYAFAGPETVKKRLYKEVLHADLDDPYLGLGSTLFAGYPFKD